MTQEYTIAIIAHVDAGKTTLTEEFLHESGAISIKGSVDEGTSTTDFFIEEKERGITIASSAVFFTWDDSLITLIDTPGHIDFSSEVDYVLSAVEGIILVCNGVEGMQSQTKLLWEKTRQFTLPAICFINFLDRKEADFDAVMEELEGLYRIPLPCILPVKKDDILCGVIDIIEELFYSLGSTYPEKIPLEYSTIFMKGREKIDSILSSIDEKFLTLYLEGDLSKKELYNCIAKHTKEEHIIPVIAGSAKYHCAINSTLNAIVLYLPSTVEREIIEVFSEEGKSIIYEIDNRLLAQFLKIITIENTQYFLLKIFSGSIIVGDSIYNTRIGERFEIQEIARLFATDAVKNDSAQRGALILVSFSQNNAQHIVPGDTFTVGEKYSLLQPTVTQAIVAMALEVNSEEEYVVLDAVLDRLVLRDSSLQYCIDEYTGQRIIHGLGELHLLVSLDYIRRESSLSVAPSALRCVYYEKLSKAVQYEYSESRILDSNTDTASCIVYIEPIESQNAVVVDFQEYDLFKEICENTVFEGIHGYPIRGMKISVYAYMYSDVNLFEKVYMRAIKDAICQAGTVMLIPIAKVNIIVPFEYVGVVTHYIAGKDGIIRSIFTRERKKIAENDIEVYMPFSNTFSLSTQLRSITKGYATCTIIHSHYE
ncbi:MAG: GTP-binding protein [Desulfovibrionaceae bacterium]